MAHTTHVVVIGAGAIGCACAYQLAKAGCAVTVVERGQLGREASWASAGMIAQAVPGDDPLANFHARGARMFPAFAAEISELTGVDASYRMNGSLRLCDDPDEWPEWVARYRETVERGVACELLSGSEVTARERALADDVVGGLFFPEDGQVDPRLYTRVLALAASRLGVQFRFGCPALGFLREGGRVVRVHTDLDGILTDYVVVAAGAWSGTLGTLLGVDLPVSPSRGQILKLLAVPPLLNHTVHWDEIYLTARTDGTILIGSTVEFVGFDTSVTVEGAYFLLKRALQIAPGLHEAAIVDHWAGLRPFAGRELPILGPAPGLENVFIATGHFRTGISPSALTGQLVAEYVTTGRTSIPLDDFAV
jgi:glycine oxidase